MAARTKELGMLQLGHAVQHIPPGLTQIVALPVCQAAYKIADSNLAHGARQQCTNGLNMLGLQIFHGRQVGEVSKRLHDRLALCKSEW